MGYNCSLPQDPSFLRQENGAIHIVFVADVNGESKNISFSDTLYVPELRTNLLSVGKITRNGFKVVFKRDSAVVIDSDGNVKVVADRIGKLYYARENEKVSNPELVWVVESSVTMEAWHRRLSHLNVIQSCLVRHDGKVQQGLRADLKDCDP